MSLSPDGTLLAVIHFSGRLSLWDVPSLRQRATWSQDLQVHLWAICLYLHAWLVLLLGAMQSYVLGLYFRCLTDCINVVSLWPGVDNKCCGLERTCICRMFMQRCACGCVCVLHQCQQSSDCVCGINRVSRLISSLLFLLLLFDPPILHSSLQPGFEEINPEWKTSLERRKKIKGSLAWRAKESRLCCWHSSAQWIQFNDLWHVWHAELYSYSGVQAQSVRLENISRPFTVSTLVCVSCLCGWLLADVQSIFDSFGPLVMTAVTSRV